ncbi:LSm family protein [Streptomyces jumonjinensis]|uniref:Uncharacterized protein n=1 Tax=Streptomyces jumonjinensis TaxID=1945 RepID=A0A646KL71_STRJU|nr:hypothetical protein [Streptomyces jumonjinensis]MQT02767.1 hypothetical protein [Streptomyces jumonjinensis]
MRALTGTDIINFDISYADILALTTAGRYVYLNADDVPGRSDAYTHTTTTTDGADVQILLDRTTLTDGEWFPDALDDSGALIPSVADEMAAIITGDGILPGRIRKAAAATEAWERAMDPVHGLAAVRAAAVREVAIYAGTQSEAARLLNMDPSTVNKLVREDALPEGWAHIGVIIDADDETVVVDLDDGHRQELPRDEVTAI